MTIVSFVYMESTRNWEVCVTGPATPLEAIQAFNAVALTCQELNPDLMMHAKTEVIPDGFRIFPAV